MKPFSFLKFLLYSMAAIFLCAYLAFSFYENLFYRQAIPAHIQVERIVEKESDGWIRESCGGVVFQLSADTIDRIKKDGTRFLDETLIGRGYEDEGNRNQRYYTYAAWKKTPFLGYEGIPVGAACLTKDNKELAKIIFQGWRTEGSFYTQKHEAELLIIPEEGILIMTYFG